MELEIKEIIQEFDISKFDKIKRLNGGRINQTFWIHTSDGEFVIQKLSLVFDDKVIEVYRKVGRFLRTKGLTVLVIMPTKTGGHHIERDKRIWRAFEYLPNEEVNHETKDVEIIKESGKILGRFHKIMQDFNQELPETLEGFHDTKKTINDLRKLFSQ